MRGWRFVVDESGFAFDTADPRVIEDAFDQFLDLLVAIRETPGQVRRSELLFDVESVDGRSLADYLVAPEIDRDLRNELAGRLDKIAEYGESPPSLDVEVDGAVVEMAPSIALCVANTSSGTNMACLTTVTAGRRGRHTVTAGSGLTAKLHFLVGAGDCPGFWRSVLVGEPDTIDHLAEHSCHPFPNCVFAESIWSQVSRFEGSAQQVWRQLIENLSGIDDHAVDVWDEFVESKRRIDRMRSAAGVECSPESPNTHANKRAMSQRTVAFGEEHVVCEWHAKLEPNRNRVHFAVRGGRVFVGLFVDHLLT